MPLTFTIYLLLLTPAMLAWGPVWVHFLRLKYGADALDQFFDSPGQADGRFVARWPLDLLLPEGDPKVEAARRRALLRTGLVVGWLIVAIFVAGLIAPVFTDRRAANEWLPAAWFASLALIGVWQLRSGERRWLPRRVAVMTIVFGPLLAAFTVLGAPR